MKNFLVVLLLLAALALGWWIGSAVPASDPWTIDDLRAFDPVDAQKPAADLTAIYTRASGIDCQIRLDVLDLPIEARYLLEIELGERKIRLSNLTPPPPDAGLDYDPVSDTLTVTLKTCAPRPATPLTVRFQSAPDAAPDLLGPLAFDAPPPSERISIQFVFYNTFLPAATPAQALRRWDGAHTGPLGGRHGLHNLLNAAEKYQIPLSLLDLKIPATLSALDYLGGMEQIRRMEQAGLLHLPAVLYGDADVSLALSHAASKQFGLRPGDSYYDSLLPPASFYPLELDDNGLTGRFRRLLSVSAGQTIQLGGDFQQTTWGIPNSVNQAFAYLAARPYIVFEPDFAPLPQTQSVDLPENPLLRSAWETHFMLSAPFTDPALARNYAGVESALRAAAARTNAPRAECEILCVLSSDEFYALLNPLGGRLVFFMAGDDEIIGPTAQFFVGMSDSSAWDLSKGEAADPAQIMGAFSDDGVYTPEVLDEKTIRFTGAEGREKTFRLTDDGLEVSLRGVAEAQIPLALSPQRRFEADWATKYRLTREVDGICYGLAGGPMVRIQATGRPALAVESFLDARALLASPEDPNFEYPAGIYLPFPMTLLHLSGLSETVVSISVSKNDCAELHKTGFYGRLTP